MAKRHTTPLGFHVAHGFRSFRSHPSKWMVGAPFDLETQLANGSATSVDLTMRSLWSTDRRVAQLTGAASGETNTKLDYVLALDAIALKIIPFSDATTALWTKVVNLLKNATAPYLEGKIDGGDYKEQLTNGISHFVDRFESDQGTAADEITGVLRNLGPYRLAEPIRIDLGTDNLYLKTAADIAFGAAVDVRLQLWGTLVPSSEWTSFMAGQACAAAEDDGPVNADDIRGARMMNLTPIPGINVSNPYGG